MSTPSPFVLLLAATLAFVLFLVVSHHNLTYRWLGSLALTGHAIVGVFVLPRLPYGWDIGKFHAVAVATQSGLSAGASSTVGSFAGLQAVIYTIFSADPAVIAILNGLCAVLIAFPAADLTRRLYPGLTAVRGLLATVLFLPLPFVFLTVPMRDALGVLLLFSLLAAVARAYEGQRWPGILSIPLWGTLSLVRPELGFILLASAIAGGLAKFLNVIIARPLSVRGLCALVTMPVVVGLAVIAPRIPVKSFADRLQYRAIGGGAYLESMTYQSSIDILVAAPTRALYFQYAPFPLHVSSLFDLVAATMLPVLTVLTIAAYRSARDCNRDLAVLVLLLTTYVLGIVGYGLIDSNFGTTVRHRIPFTFILCILAAPTLERWTNLLVGTVGLDSTVDSASASERVGN